jgi:subtilisin-like proprotein convertase family protein
MRKTRILAGLALFAIGGAALGVPVSFPGTNTGAIPDNNPAGRTVSFAVSGLSTPVASVQLSLDLTHTWVGDLTAVLTAPDGVARLVVLGRVGTARANLNGDSSNLGGTYVFGDLGSPGMWPVAASGPSDFVLTPGTYRTTSAGSPGRSNAGGCPTSLRGVFAGLSAAEANGTWTLLVTDAVASDTGSIGTSVLTLDTVSQAIFADGFESGAPTAPEAVGGVVGAPPHCINKVQADVTGDGLTDFIVARTSGSNINWIVRENLGNGTASATEVTFQLGNPATDFIDTLDLDGDRIADPAVWTEAAPGTARYQVRLSSRGGAVRSVVLGQTGDDPTQSGDYDGDGIDDLAVHRAPPFGAPAGPIQVIFLRSGNGALGTVNTGTGNDGSQFAISGFDYSGDGLADVVIQESDSVTPAVGRFRMFNPLTGIQFSTFTLGTSSDFLIPGNHVGTPWHDVTVRRTVSGNREFTTRDSQTGTVAPVVTFSITGDSSLGGDYDGDGLSDLGLWRPSATAGASFFQIRLSSNPATLWTVNFGQQGDFPVASSRVH